VAYAVGGARPRTEETRPPVMGATIREHAAGEPVTSGAVRETWASSTSETDDASGRRDVPDRVDNGVVAARNPFSRDRYGRQAEHAGTVLLVGVVRMDLREAVAQGGHEV
jgi:hypothetical protein